MKSGARPGPEMPGLSGGADPARRRALALPTRRGVASLSILLLLMIAMLLVAAWAQRNLLTEVRIAANQVRGAVAFEAAEAGLAWAQAMLNAGSSLGSDCQPSGVAGTTSFTARYLNPPDANGRFAPRRRGAAGSEVPLQMLCARQAAGWVCHCPSTQAATLSPSGDDPLPSFLVELTAAAQPGMVQVSSTGCNHLAHPCLAGADSRADAVSRLRVTLALLPALSTPPAATMTALGEVDAGAAALGLHNADALSGGLAVQAGGPILGNLLRVHTAPGAPVAAASLARDDALAALTPAQFFSRHHGTDLLQWLQQPGVQVIDCSGECGAALQTALADQTDVARIGVRGDVQLSGSLQVGSPARPVVLVVDGALRLTGPVRLHGLVHARSLEWNTVGQGQGGLLHGALLLSESYRGNGAPDLVYDAALMTRLKRQTGSWLRVPGSWRDF